MAFEERRRGRDRRARMRGGRRSTDRVNYGPLILLVTSDRPALQFWEALLIERRFSVVPSSDAAAALEAYGTLRPDVILASKRDLPVLRDLLSFCTRDRSTPLVELVSTPNLVDPVIQAIRRALHTPHRMAS